MTLSSNLWEIGPERHGKHRGVGLEPAPGERGRASLSLEQLEHGLRGLGRHGERGGSQRLAGLQHQHVGSLLVHVGEGEVVRPSNDR